MACGTDAAGREEDVHAPAAAQIEQGLARLQLGQPRRVATPQADRLGQADLDQVLRAVARREADRRRIAGRAAAPRAAGGTAAVGAARAVAFTQPRCGGGVAFPNRLLDFAHDLLRTIDGLRWLHDSTTHRRLRMGLLA